MTPGELLRACAVVVEGGAWRLSMLHPPGGGRFLFAGGDTELLNETERGRVYSVSVQRVLRYVAKAIADGDTV